MIPDQIQIEIDKVVASRVTDIISIAMDSIERAILKGHIRPSECTYSVALAKYTQLKIRMYRFLKSNRDDYHGITHSWRWSSYGKRYCELETDIAYWKKIKDNLKEQG